MPSIPAIINSTFTTKNPTFAIQCCSRYELRFATKEEKIRFDRNTRRARCASITCTIFLIVLAFARPIYGPYIDRFGEDGDGHNRGGKGKLDETQRERLNDGHASSKRNRHNSNKDESTFHARYRKIEEERRLY